MGLNDQLKDAMKDAMKAKDSLRLTTIRMTRSAIKNKEIDLKKDLEDQDVVALISTLVKQRREAAGVYRDGGRDELAEKEEAEISILQEFLPTPLSEDEVKAIIEQAVADTGAASMKDMGPVMKIVAEKTTGRADGKQVSGLVRARLSS